MPARRMPAPGMAAVVGAIGLHVVAFKKQFCEIPSTEMVGTRMQRMRRSSVLEMGIAPHTDHPGLWPLGLDAGVKGMSI